jgi:hypothetical protein
MLGKPIRPLHVSIPQRRMHSKRRGQFAQYLYQPDTDELLGNGRLAVACLDHLISQVATIRIPHHDAQLVVAGVKVAHFDYIAVFQMHHHPDFLHFEIVFP